MNKRQTRRFAVFSPDLVVPRLEDMERDFMNAWVRMKGNHLSGGAQKLGYRQEKRRRTSLLTHIPAVCVKLG